LRKQFNFSDLAKATIAEGSLENLSIPIEIGNPGEDALPAAL
jgi:hypothetical protein